ncbi:MAG: efflux RND transporter periplasmic adaptor subunit [Gammaproteobacteria bacterium]|nr:MAG: efflux RND transporter periplasmic adaptor subunit [Gammaproteobacteria bacterium]
MKMQFENLKRYKSWLISAAITTAIGLWLISGQIGNENSDPDNAQVAKQETEARPGVRVRRQTAEEVTRTIAVNGRTAPARVVDINAETDGRIVAVGRERGDRLDRGDVIVRLDERDRHARLAQASATVKQRELEYAAREKLQGESYVSEAQLQEAAALLEAAKAELTRAELDINYMVISAPFDGALQERHVEIGDFVKRGDPVASFVDDRTLIVRASISEYDAHYVTKGEEGTAELATGEMVTGVVRYMAPVADEATRTFTVELAIDNSDGAYRAGMTAKLMIPGETVSAQRVSPSLLTLDDAGNLGVKTLNDAGVVEFYRADIVMSSSDGIWIAGLPHLMTIITVGQGFVNEGALVDAVPEDDIETAVAIKSGTQDD